MPAVTTWLGSTIRPRLPVVAGSGRPRRPLWGSWRMRTALSLTWSVMSSPSWRTNAAASSDSLTSGPRMSKRDPRGLQAAAVEERHLGVEFGAVVSHA
jgi:hypothetical protein